MIPSRFAPVLFGLLLSGLMSLIVSGVATARAVGVGDGFGSIWLQSWGASWLIAFPTVLVVAPFVRRVVGALTTS